MVGFVNDTMAGWPAEETQNVVLALSAEAGTQEPGRGRRKDADAHRSRAAS